MFVNIVGVYTLFCKNIVYKNIQARVAPKFKNMLRIIGIFFKNIEARENLQYSYKIKCVFETTPLPFMEYFFGS